MTHIGRNDLCPCGSGEKYKKCCLSKAPTFAFSKVVDFEWRKLRQLEGTVIDQHLIPYLFQTLPASVMEQAMEDCLPDDLPEEMDQKILFNSFLLPWILFNWVPFEDVELKHFDPELTIAENYLQAYPHQLQNDERRFLETMNTTFYSFYVVLAVEKEKSLFVKDMLLGTTQTLKERQGTHFLNRGDIVFSRILTLDQQSIFVGMAPFILPLSYHMALVDLKEALIEENDHLPLSGDILRQEFDLDLVDYFFEAIAEAYKLPTLFNTDGEKMQFCISHFKLTLPLKETLHRLLPMTLSDDAEDILSEAKCTASGEVEEIHFSWLKKGNKKHKNWENTIHGNITLKKGKLTLETNSLERAEHGRKIIQKLLGEQITFQRTLIESQEQKLKSLPPFTEENETQPTLPEIPDVQAHIEAMAKSYWATWFDEPIPALDNQTPHEAAKTEKGRERLEALLLYYECMDAKREADDPMKTDIEWIRKTLSLEK